MKILDGVYQLLTPFPQYKYEEAKKLRVELERAPRVTKGLPYVMPYLIKHGSDTMLVDCGWNTDVAYAALEEGMGEFGSHPSEITQLVITHVHPDHYGMSGRLKQV
ncbi:MAG: MBL fold metallo-hydrolase, partial [Chloroflexi bacterium]|nr:MBL fold metallo-hydrolase [Chloroflexota bacterium]